MLLLVKSDYITGINDIITGTISFSGYHISTGMVFLDYSTGKGIDRYWDGLSQLQYRYGYFTGDHVRYWDGLSRLLYRYGNFTGYHISVLGWCFLITDRYGNFAGYRSGKMKQSFYHTVAFATWE